MNFFFFPLVSGLALTYFNVHMGDISEVIEPPQTFEHLVSGHRDKRIEINGKAFFDIANTLTITAKLDKPVQTCILALEGRIEQSFLCSRLKDEKKYECKVDPAAVRLPGVYSVSILAFVSNEHVSSSLGKVHISAEGSPMAHEDEDFAAKPEIMHTPQSPPRQPMALLPLLGIVLVLSPWFLLLKSVHLLNLVRRSPDRSVLFGALGLWMLYFLFAWIELNFPQFLYYGSLLAIPTLYVARKGLQN